MISGAVAGKIAHARLHGAPHHGTSRDGARGQHSTTRCLDGGSRPLIRLSVGTLRDGFPWFFGAARFPQATEPPQAHHIESTSRDGAHRRQSTILGLDAVRAIGQSESRDLISTIPRVSSGFRGSAFPCNHRPGFHIGALLATTPATSLNNSRTRRLGGSGALVRVSGPRATIPVGSSGRRDARPGTVHRSVELAVRRRSIHNPTPVHRPGRSAGANVERPTRSAPPFAFPLNLERPRAYARPHASREHDQMRPPSPGS